MIRVVTIGGEFGSGRTDIGRGVAAGLGFNLLDNSLIEEIARTADVDPELARRYDEAVDSWFHRLRKALWHGGYEGVATTTDAGPCDADVIAGLTNRVIREAATQGQAVIVGRGSQCVLQDRADVFHVFIYAPRRERIERVRREERKGDAESFMDYWDRRRQVYIRRYFGQDWTNRHLYDLMLSSSMGEAAAVAAIVDAVQHYKA